MTILFVSWFALAIPFLAAGAVYLYRLLVVHSVVSYESRVVAREVGAAVLAIAVGFGWWMTALVVGFLLDVVPLFSGVEGYTYAEEWTAGGAVVAVLVVPVTWWLLRRSADPGPARVSPARGSR